MMEAIPPSHRPAWSYGVLDAVARPRDRSDPLIAEAAAVAGNPAEWGSARDAFRRIRVRVLQLDELDQKGLLEDEMLLYVLSLAEFVMKLCHNAVDDGDDSFDEDTAEWMVETVRKLTLLKSAAPSLGARAWDALVDSLR